MCTLLQDVCSTLEHVLCHVRMKVSEVNFSAFLLYSDYTTLNEMGQRWMRMKHYAVFMN